MKIVLIGATSVSGSTASLLAAWGHNVLVHSSTSLDTNLPESDTAVVLPGLASDEIEQAVSIASSRTQRLVYCGSYRVYRAYARWSRDEPGEPDLVPLLEDDPLSHSGDWASLEASVSSSGLSTTILRIPETYGPGTNSDRVLEYVTQMDSGASEIVISPNAAEWRCATIYGEDLAYAVALTAKNSKAVGQVYNVADSVAFTQFDWIRALGRAAGWSGEVVTREDAPFDQSKNYDQHLIVDSTKIRQQLGYNERTPIIEALSASIKCEKAGREVDFPPSA